MLCTWPGTEVRAIDAAVQLRAAYGSGQASSTTARLPLDFCERGEAAIPADKDASILRTVLCVESCCRAVGTSWAIRPRQTAAALDGLGTLGCLELPLGHTLGLRLVKAVQLS